MAQYRHFSKLFSTLFKDYSVSIILFVMSYCWVISVYDSGSLPAFSCKTPVKNPACFLSYLYNIQLFIQNYSWNLSIIILSTCHKLLWHLTTQCYQMVDWLHTTYSIPILHLFKQSSTKQWSTLFCTFSNKGNTKQSAHLFCTYSNKHWNKHWNKEIIVWDYFFVSMFVSMFVWICAE